MDYDYYFSMQWGSCLIDYNLTEEVIKKIENQIYLAKRDIHLLNDKDYPTQKGILKEVLSLKKLISDINKSISDIDVLSHQIYGEPYNDFKALTLEVLNSKKQKLELDAKTKRPSRKATQTSIKLIAKKNISDMLNYQKLHKYNKMADELLYINDLAISTNKRPPKAIKDSWLISGDTPTSTEIKTPQK